MLLGDRRIVCAFDLYCRMEVSHWASAAEPGPGRASRYSRAARSNFTVPEVADRKAVKEQTPPPTATVPPEPANATSPQPQVVGQPAKRPSVFERIQPLVLARFPFDVPTVIAIFRSLLFSADGSIH